MLQEHEQHQRPLHGFIWLEHTAPVHNPESLRKRKRVLKHAGLQLNKLAHVALLDNRAVLVAHAAAAATRVHQHLCRGVT